MKLCYVPKKFRSDSLDLIAKCEAILNRYAEQGYDMTLRQLYYQLVAADEIENNVKSYTNLGNLVNDARLAGLLDWLHLVDRTRNLQSLAHWEKPSDIINAAASQFRLDKWSTQPCRVEVWIEKEALAGVFQRVCNSLDVPFFSCRGYSSQSEMWRAGVRLQGYQDKGQQPVILHFGDHDPSGIDMTRDIRERLQLFTGGDITVDRLALNMSQVRQYKPPPNPAKITDSRANDYIDRFGSQSWELDALDPDTLAGLVTDAVNSHLDQDAWDEACDNEDLQRQTLKDISTNYAAIAQHIKDGDEW